MTWIEPEVQITAKCETCPRETAGPRAILRENAAHAYADFTGSARGTPTLIEVVWLCESCALLSENIVL